MPIMPPYLDIYNVGVTSMRQTEFDISSPNHFYGYYAFDLSKSLVNEAIGNAWISKHLEKTNQRIWSKVIMSSVARQLYYENYHDSHSPSINSVTHELCPWPSDPYAHDTNEGAYEGSIWASNIQPNAYGTYEGLTKLWEGKFERHSMYNVEDPKYIWLNNETPYLYYIIDVNNNYSGNSGIGFRRLQWQG